MAVRQVKANLPLPGETKAQFITRSVRILMKSGKSKEAAIGIALRVWDNVAQTTQITPNQIDSDVVFTGRPQPQTQRLQSGNVSVKQIAPFAELSNKLDNAQRQHSQQSFSNSGNIQQQLISALRQAFQGRGNTMNYASSGPMGMGGGPPGMVNQLQSIFTKQLQLQQETNSLLGQLGQISQGMYQELATIRSTGMNIKWTKKGSQPPKISDYWNASTSPLRTQSHKGFLENFFDSAEAELPEFGQKILKGIRIATNPIQAFRKFTGEKIRGWSTKLRPMTDPAYKYQNDLAAWKKDAGIKSLSEERLQFKVQTETIPQALADINDNATEQVDLLRNIYEVNREHLNYVSKGQVNRQYTQTLDLSKHKFNIDRGEYQTETEFNKYQQNVSRRMQSVLDRTIKDQEKSPFGKIVKNVNTFMSGFNKRMFGTDDVLDTDSLKSLAHVYSINPDLASEMLSAYYEKQWQTINKNESLNAQTFGWSSDDHWFGLAPNVRGQIRHKNDENKTDPFRRLDELSNIINGKQILDSESQKELLKALGNNAKTKSGNYRSAKYSHELFELNAKNGSEVNNGYFAIIDKKESDKYSDHLYHKIPHDKDPNKIVLLPKFFSGLPDVDLEYEGGGSPTINPGKILGGLWNEVKRFGKAAKGSINDIGVENFGEKGPIRWFANYFNNRNFDKVIDPVNGKELTAGNRFNLSPNQSPIVSDWWGTGTSPGNLNSNLDYNIFNTQDNPIFVKILNEDGTLVSEATPFIVKVKRMFDPAWYDAGGTASFKRKTKPRRSGLLSRRSKELRSGGLFETEPGQEHELAVLQDGETVITKHDTKDLIRYLHGIYLNTKKMVIGTIPTINGKLNNSFTSTFNIRQEQKLQKDRDNVQKNILKYIKKIYNWLDDYGLTNGKGKSGSNKDNESDGFIDKFLKAAAGLFGLKFLWNKVKDLFKSGLTKIKDIIKTGFKTITEPIKNLVKSVWDKGKNILQSGLDKGKQLIKPGLEFIKDKWNAGKDLIKSGLNKGKIAIGDGFKGIWSNIKNFGKSIGGNAFKFGKSALRFAARNKGNIAFMAGGAYAQYKLAQSIAEKEGISVDEAYNRIESTIEQYTTRNETDDIESDVPLIDINRHHAGGRVTPKFHYGGKISNFIPSTPGLIKSDIQDEVPIIAQKDEYILTKGETKSISKLLEDLNKKFEEGHNFYKLVDNIYDNIWYLRDIEENKVDNEYKIINENILRPIKDFNGLYPFLVSAIRDAAGNGPVSSSGGLFGSITSGLKSLAGNIGNFFFGGGGENRPSGIRSGNGYSGADIVGALPGGGGLPSTGSGGPALKSGDLSQPYTGLGDIVNKKETGGQGYSAITLSKNDPGGASYGKYQYSYTQGSLREFVDSLKDKNPEMYQQLNNAWKSASQGKQGEFGQIWKGLAGNEEFQKYYDEHGKKVFYTDALKGIKDPKLRAQIQNNPALQEAFFSATTNHGAGGGRQVLRKAYHEGISDEDLIRNMYQARIDRTVGHKQQKGLHNRYRSEVNEILALNQQFKSGQLNNSSTTLTESNNSRYTPELQKMLDLKQKYESGQLSDKDRPAVENIMKNGGLEAINQAQQAADAGADRQTINNYMDIAHRNAENATNFYGKHGYSQDYRSHKNRYDCSSFVGRTLKEAGFKVNPLMTTDSIGKGALDKYFDRIEGPVTSSKGLQRGDILWRKGHVEFYDGNDKVIGAHSSKTGVSSYALKNQLSAGGFNTVFRLKKEYADAMSKNGGKLPENEEKIKELLAQYESEQQKIQNEQQNQSKTNQDVTENGSNIEQLNAEMQKAQVEQAQAQQAQQEAMAAEMEQQKNLNPQDMPASTNTEGKTKDVSNISPRTPDLTMSTPSGMNNAQTPMGTKRGNLADNQQTNARNPDYMTENLIQNLFKNTMIAIQQLSNMFAIGNNTMSPMHV